MPDGFVTQLVNEQPQVALVVDQPLVEQHAVAWCREHHLEPVVLSAAKITAHSFSADAYWYKLIWYVDLAELSQAEFERVATRLTSFSAPMVIICRGITPIFEGNGGYFHDWAVLSRQQQQRWQWLQHQFPSAQFVMLFDIVDTSTTLLNPCYHLCSTLSQQVLSNPVVQLYPTTLEQALAVVKNVVFKPANHVPVVIRGSRVLSTQLAQIIQEQYFVVYGQNVPIQSVPAQGMEWLQDATLHEVPSASLLDQAIKTLVYQLPKLSAAPLAPPVADEFVVPAPEVEPVAEPVIEQSPPPVRPNLKLKRPLQDVPPITRAKSVPVAETAEAPPAPAKPRSTENEVDAAILKVFAQERTKEKVSNVHKAAKTTQVMTAKSKRRRSLYRVGVSMGSLIMLIIGLWTLFQLEIWAIKGEVFAQTPRLETGVALNRAQKWWGQALVTTLGWQYQVYSKALGWASVIPLDHAQHYAELWTQLQQLGPSLSSWRQGVNELAAQAWGSAEASSFTWAELSDQANTLQQQLAQTQALITQLDATILSSSRQQQLQEFETVLSAQRKQLSVFQQLAPFLPKYLGLEGKKTYAILIQNNQELRPTGGFIQAIGIITLDKGSLVNSQFWSVYDLDAKLVGVAKPPDDLQLTLGESRWWLRDSNWSPDFPEAAAQAALLLNQATNTQVDGVVAVNLESMISLLKVAGPLEIPEFNEVITDRNLAERMEFHSEVQLVRTPGTTPPLDYTATVAQKLVTNLAQQPPEKNGAILAALGEGLNNHETLLSFVSNPAFNEPLLTLGWTGSMVTPNCPAQFQSNECLVDTFAQVEANVGINKANYYLDEKIAHRVNITQDSIQHHRAITFTNTATNNSWPKGAYKAYTRFYVPKDSQITSVKLDGAPLAESQYATVTDQDRLVLSLLTETPVQQTSVLEIEYQRPNPYGTALAYSFFEQKQPGVKTDAYQVTVASEPGVNPVLIAPQAQVSGQTITFSTPPTGHVFVGASFK